MTATQRIRALESPTSTRHPHEVIHSQRNTKHELCSRACLQRLGRLLWDLLRLSASHHLRVAGDPNESPSFAVLWVATETRTLAERTKTDADGTDQSGGIQARASGSRELEGTADTRTAPFLAYDYLARPNFIALSSSKPDPLSTHIDSRSTEPAAAPPSDAFKAQRATVGPSAFGMKRNPARKRMTPVHHSNRSKNTTDWSTAARRYEGFSKGVLSLPRADANAERYSGWMVKRYVSDSRP
ncbi:uncharacterized protein C8Q71DRAFT_726703 [Rhodofomes roseus]|uniref:Uncharacterized protein n=1 Tax=Rhodofomes roseus TaxID=34475 RepID=A0ABQ8K580_9APHY|nr:uncharacterized protein C8Q71DRAFT_726703 [Rhodofomes roseus]KAH9831861.1 hypothetical protein C8Q71DRAFT_726703 [Rhodofomes roseus]